MRLIFTENFLKCSDRSGVPQSPNVPTYDLHCSRRGWRPAPAISYLTEEGLNNEYEEWTIRVLLGSCSMPVETWSLVNRFSSGSKSTELSLTLCRLNLEFGPDEEVVVNLKFRAIRFHLLAGLVSLDGLVLGSLVRCYGLDWEACDVFSFCFSSCRLVWWELHCWVCR